MIKRRLISGHVEQLFIGERCAEQTFIPDGDEIYWRDFNDRPVTPEPVPDGLKLDMVPPPVASSGGPEDIRIAWDKVRAALDAIPDTDATTTDRFWDCECEGAYIHDGGDTECSICGAVGFDQPPARLREIIGMLMSEAGL